MDIRSSRIDNSGQYDKKKQIFALVTMKGELHHFQAPSEADMNAWCNIILEQSGVRKENVRPSFSSDLIVLATEWGSQYTSACNKKELWPTKGNSTIAIALVFTHYTYMYILIQY